MAGNNFYLSIPEMYALRYFYFNLNWELKWAFLNACHSTSVCRLSVRPSVRMSVNLSHQNHWTTFNLLRLKTSLGEGNSGLYKWRVMHFFKERWNEIMNIQWQNVISFSLKTTGSFLTKIDKTNPFVKGIQGFKLTC